MFEILIICTYIQIFTDGSKVNEKVAAAAVSSVAPNRHFSCGLRDPAELFKKILETKEWPKEWT